MIARVLEAVGVAVVVASNFAARFVASGSLGWQFAGWRVVRMLGAVVGN